MNSVESRLREAEAIQRLPQVRRVFGFLSDIGLLRTATRFEGNKCSKISVADVLKAGDIEPRVLEVFPAALAAYPSSFVHQELLPADLQEIIDALHKGQTRNLSYKGIPYEKMQQWMTFPLPDKRVKPISARKRVKTFSLSPATCSLLEKLAETTDSSQTEVIERAVKEFSINGSR